MQIKSRQRDHLSPIRLAEIQKSDTPHIGKASGKAALVYLVGGSENWHNPTGGQFGHICQTDKCIHPLMQ